MRRDNIEIAAEIPAGLRDADEVLVRYGRWAMHRHKKQRCGSAEGMFTTPPNDDDRQPREMLMPGYQAIDVQRALYRVPELQRVVLAILYVPQRIPAVVQLRRLHIPPRLSRERHIDGLRMFANIHRVLSSVPPDHGGQ